MAGINEFLIFDENNQNTMTNQAYSTDDQRLNGVSTGIARSALQNKSMRQVSMMANAIGEVMSGRNIDAKEDETLKENLNNFFTIEGMSNNDNEGANSQQTIDNLFSVGDIKTTTRQSLTDKWLKCNGDVISKEDFPDLAISSPHLQTINGVIYNFSLSEEDLSNLDYEDFDLLNTAYGIYGVKSAKFSSVLDSCKYGSSGLVFVTMWRITFYSNSSLSSTTTSDCVLLFYSNNISQLSSGLINLQHTNMIMGTRSSSNYFVISSAKVRHINNNFIIALGEDNTSSNTYEGNAGTLYSLNATSLSQSSKFTRVYMTIYKNADVQSVAGSNIIDIIYKNIDTQGESYYVVVCEGNTSHYITTAVYLLKFTSLSSKNTIGYYNGPGYDYAIDNNTFRKVLDNVLVFWLKENKGTVDTGYLYLLQLSTERNVIKSFSDDVAMENNYRVLDFDNSQNETYLISFETFSSNSNFQYRFFKITKTEILQASFAEKTFVESKESSYSLIENTNNDYIVITGAFILNGYLYALVKHKKDDLYENKVYKLNNFYDIADINTVLNSELACSLPSDDKQRFDGDSNSIKIGNDYYNIGSSEYKEFFKNMILPKIEDSNANSFIKVKK